MPNRRAALEGCLLGCAVGDSIELPFEGIRPRRMRKLLERQLPHRFFSGAGWTVMTRIIPSLWGRLSPETHVILMKSTAVLHDSYYAITTSVSPYGSGILIFIGLGLIGFSRSIGRWIAN